MSTGEPTLDLTSVFDALNVGIIILDRQSRVVVWNDWIAHATRKMAMSVRGTKFFDIFPELQATRLPLVIEEAFEIGTSSVLTHSLNKLLPLRDESDREVLHNIIVRPLAFGAAQHCVLQVDDVTLAVTRERVLRERQTRVIMRSSIPRPTQSSQSILIFRYSGSTRRLLAFWAMRLLN